jgi:hypothetical protein
MDLFWKAPGALHGWVWMCWGSSSYTPRATVGCASALRPESATGTLHHVMVRGIERTAIFRDDTDRAEFLARLAGWVERGALTVYAWALLPNHAHLLPRTGAPPSPIACARFRPDTSWGRRF